MVPWVSVPLADGTHDLGNMHNATANRCFLRRLCQVCGDPLGKPMVLLLSTTGLTDMHSTEPALHPECAAYSQVACPMVAGRMDRYRSSPSRSEGKAGQTCPDPGCDCGGWVSHGAARNAGRTAEPWHAVWCDDYTVTVPDEDTARAVERGVIPVGKTLGAMIPNPLRIRPVTAPSVVAR